MIMGIMNIAAILSTYVIAQKYTSPELVIFIVAGLSIFLFAVSFTIIGAFEQVVFARQKEAAHHRELLALKDQFVFVAAHELRSPANAIKWALETLELHKSPFLEKEADVFKVLAKSSEKLLVLVKDLLEVSRIEAKTISIRMESVDLQKIVDESLKSLTSYAEKLGIELKNIVSRQLPPVYADVSRLKEVLDNLVTNAIKYNRENGMVTVSAEKEGNGMTLRISDEGNGIAPDDRPHIFEKFWRSVDAHNIEGTGLGLFIVQKLVTLMHGRVYFKTEKDIGTTFSVYLPCMQTSKENAA